MRRPTGGKRVLQPESFLEPRLGPFRGTILGPF
jgi:hypothetical protein